MKNLILASFLAILPLSAMAQTTITPHWTVPPKEYSFGKIKLVKFIGDSETGNFTPYSMDQIIDLMKVDLAAFKLTVPLDGDATKICVGNYIDQTGQHQVTLCALKAVDSNSCETIVLDKCLKDNSVLEDEQVEKLYSGAT